MEFSDAHLFKIVKDLCHVLEPYAKDQINVDTQSKLGYIVLYYASLHLYNALLQLRKYGYDNWRHNFSNSDFLLLHYNEVMRVAYLAMNYDPDGNKLTNLNPQEFFHPVIASPQMDLYVRMKITAFISWFQGIPYGGIPS